MQKELYILRHGRTLYNLQKRVQGRGVDSSLDPLGRAQGEAFFEQYQQVPFELVITSSLKRSIETVEPFIGQGIAHKVMPELDEISWGIYEGQLSSEEMHREYRRVVASWGAGEYHASIEEGDSALDMQKRLSQAVEVIKQLPQQRLLICTHGGSMAFLMALLQEEPLSNMTQYKHRNTGLCKFSYQQNQGFTLLLQDDISHLDNLDADLSH